MNELIPKYKLNQVVENTESFGTCKVVDIFYSVTSGRFCYEVLVAHSNYLVTEEELNKKLI